MLLCFHVSSLNLRHDTAPFLQCCAQIWCVFIVLSLKQESLTWIHITGTCTALLLSSVLLILLLVLTKWVSTLSGTPLFKCSSLGSIVSRQVLLFLSKVHVLPLRLTDPCSVSTSFWEPFENVWYMMRWTCDLNKCDLKYYKHKKGWLSPFLQGNAFLSNLFG